MEEKLNTEVFLCSILRTNIPKPPCLPSSKKQRPRTEILIITFYDTFPNSSVQSFPIINFTYMSYIWIAIFFMKKFE